MLSLFKHVLCGLLLICSAIAFTQAALSSTVKLASPDYMLNTHATSKIVIEAVKFTDTPSQALTGVKLTSRNGPPAIVPVDAPKPAVDPDGRGDSRIGSARVETTERNGSPSPTRLATRHFIDLPNACESDVWSRCSLR